MTSSLDYYESSKKMSHNLDLVYARKINKSVQGVGEGEEGNFREFIQSYHKMVFDSYSHMVMSHIN
jgi:hypothetical protein